MVQLNNALIVALLLTHTNTVHTTGTTLYLKDVFIGRCWYYQTMQLQENNVVLQEKVNCRDLWNAFYKSFAYKDPCDVTLSSYKSFFDMFQNRKKIRNALFWSGSNDLVHDFTFINDEFIVLEDTLTGYVINGLTWCGTNSTKDGLNYKSCNSNGKTCNAMYPTWFHASANFAGRAAGQSHVLLNASRSRNRNAYYEKSFFRTVEMPRLNIDKLNVLVATSIGQPVREQCGTNSLQELEQDAKSRKIQTTCTDQPKLVLRIFCLKFPTADQCAPLKFLNKKYTREREATVKWRIVSIVLGVVCFLLLIFTASTRYWRRKRKTSLVITPSSAQVKKDKEICTSISPASILWRTICFILIAVAALLLLIIGITIIKNYVFAKNSKFKYVHNWSFSKKPMLSNEEYQNDNNNIMV